MWYSGFTLPSLLLMNIFLGYYFARPRLRIQLNRTFLALLLLDILTILFSLLSTFADETHELWPQWVLWVLNMGFFCLYLARIFWFYLFTADAVRYRTRKGNLFTSTTEALIVLAELITLSSFWTGAVFRIDAEGYHRGPAYMLLYVTAFLFLCLSMGMTLRYRKRLAAYEFSGILSYNLVLILGNVIRFLVPQYLVMDTACVMAIIIIYLTYENPDLYLKDRGPAFNMRAFQDALDERIFYQSYRVQCFVVRNYNDCVGVYGPIQVNHGMALVSSYLVRQFPREMVFDLGNGCFALLGDSDMDWDQIRDKISLRFRQPWRADEVDLFLDASFVRVSAESGITDTKRVINALLISLDEAGDRLSDRIMIDLDAEDPSHRVDVKHDLEQAIDLNQVEVFLQPIVDAGTERVVAAEALSRIRDQQGNLISPTVFIPVAEKTGQINRLGDQVLEKTCAFIRKHGLQTMGLSWINVNLSPIQCMNRDLCQQFTAILDRYGVSSSSIHLEITEESMVDESMLMQQLQILRESGFQFALDDYGSGYSNLTRVRHCPFINVKLDMGVVRSHCEERDDLLPTLVSTFKKMNFSITAEGIESAEMARIMREIGCDYLQGFYYSRPLPMDQFVDRYGRAS